MNRLLIGLLTLLAVPRCPGQTKPYPSTSPDPAIIATVLGKDVTMQDANRLNVIVFGALLEKYITEHKIVATDDELDGFLVAMDEAEKKHLADLETRQATLTRELQSTSLTEQQRQAKEAQLKTVETSLRGLKPFVEQKAKEHGQRRSADLGTARQVVTRWKTNKALYDQYGGRVIFQQAGDEPMDAYRAFLKEEQAKGDFQIFDAKAEAHFWEQFGTEPRPLSKEAGDEAMNKPWWLKVHPKRSTKALAGNAIRGA